MHDRLFFFPALHKTNDFKKFLCNLDLTAQVRNSKFTSLFCKAISLNKYDSSI